MKRLLFIAATFVAVISFQNCAPQQMQSLDENAISSDSANNLIGADPVDQSPDMEGIVKKVEIGTLDRPVRFVESTLLKTIDGIPRQLRFVVDLDGNTVSVLSGATTVLSKTCLPAEAKQKIESLINGPKLCEVQVSNMICTQVIQKPFAHLLFRDNSAEALALGAGINGCGHLAVEFCDGSDNELESVLLKMKGEFTSYSCQ